MILGKTYQQIAAEEEARKAGLRGWSEKFVIFPKRLIDGRTAFFQRLERRSRVWDETFGPMYEYREIEDRRSDGD